MVSLREITVDDWAVLRDIRLTALTEAPYAFGSTYAREAAFTEDQWRGRINGRSVTFFAYTGSAGPADEPAGLAGSYVEDETAELVSLWVRPSARGLGVGATLIEAVAGWGRARGYRALFLWVTESNAPARRLYQRCSFTPTGKREPLPSDPSLWEVQLRRAL
jgi:ribosomal protein S18 acetylase RimI-like enzyme